MGQALPRSCVGGPAVIFQHVVPILRPYGRRSRRSGAKVQIGCNDLQGADLSRRLLHGSVLKPSPTAPVFDGYNVLRDHSQPLASFNTAEREARDSLYSGRLLKLIVDKCTVLANLGHDLKIVSPELWGGRPGEHWLPPWSEARQAPESDPLNFLTQEHCSLREHLGSHKGRLPGRPRWPASSHLGTMQSHKHLLEAE